MNRKITFLSISLILAVGSSIAKAGPISEGPSTSGVAISPTTRNLSDAQQSKAIALLTTQKASAYTVKCAGVTSLDAFSGCVVANLVGDLSTSGVQYVLDGAPSTSISSDENTRMVSSAVLEFLRDDAMNAAAGGEPKNDFTKRLIEELKKRAAEAGISKLPTPVAATTLVNGINAKLEDLTRKPGSEPEVSPHFIPLP